MYTVGQWDKFHVHVDFRKVQKSLKDKQGRLVLAYKTCIPMYTQCGGVQALAGLKEAPALHTLVLDLWGGYGSQ